MSNHVVVIQPEDYRATIERIRREQNNGGPFETHLLVYGLVFLFVIALIVFFAYLIPNWAFDGFCPCGVEDVAWKRRMAFYDKKRRAKKRKQLEKRALFESLKLVYQSSGGAFMQSQSQHNTKPTEAKDTALIISAEEGNAGYISTGSQTNAVRFQSPSPIPPSTVSEWSGPKTPLISSSSSDLAALSIDEYCLRQYEDVLLDDDVDTGIWGRATSTCNSGILRRSQWTPPVVVVDPAYSTDTENSHSLSVHSSV